RRGTPTPFLRSLFPCASHLDQRRLRDPRATDPLTLRRLLRRRIGRDLNDLAGFRRLVQRLDNTDVLEAFSSGGLRLALLPDAIREVQQLRRELVALADLPSRRPAAGGRGVFEGVGV